MAKLRTLHAFRVADVAAVFPGQLTVRGAPELLGHEAEVEGDVPESDLIHALEAAIDAYPEPMPPGKNVVIQVVVEPPPPPEPEPEPEPLPPTLRERLRPAALPAGVAVGVVALEQVVRLVT